MTPSSENLSQLWQSDSGSRAIDHHELLLQLEQRRRSFDRTIRWRDLRETSAGLFITILYLWFAVRAGNGLDRAADLWLAACGIWIFFFLQRYSRLRRKPAPEQTLSVYRRELVERYDRQIRLLKNAKYWYIIPIWLGLLYNEASHLIHGMAQMRFWIAVIVVTVLSAFGWWLNEVLGVRCLQRKRRELASLIGEEGASE